MTAHKRLEGPIPTAPNFNFEMELWKAGLTAVAGVDEAGRGALAGPVAVGVLIFPAQLDLSEKLAGVRDSKQMRPADRQLWAERLPQIALACSVGFASSQEIDQIGIVPATCLAAARAIQSLSISPQHLLLDFLHLPDSTLPQTSLVKGDSRSLSIAAASILAKTSRDRVLCNLDEAYPGYGLAGHKGYGTVAHRRALFDLGPSPIHRRSFRYKLPADH
jgi:ribonuclease HII